MQKCPYNPVLLFEVWPRFEHRAVGDEEGGASLYKPNGRYLGTLENGGRGMKGLTWNYDYKSTECKKGHRKERKRGGNEGANIKWLL